VGREAIRDFFAAVAGPESNTFPLKSLHHHTATHVIYIVDEYSANGRCYFAVLTQNGLDHWGRYVDELARVDGVWKIARRRVSVDGRRPDSPFAE
jgi:hypothetical protein